MGFAINTNLDALNAYQNLTNTQNALSKSLTQLSSGLRINNAGDDAAGLTISTDIGAQISGLTRAKQNAADGTSVVQTADGGLQQVQTLLGQLRDLAVQAANDSNSVSARTAIATQATAITNQIQQIGNSTNFNGIYLLNGSKSTLNFQVGANADAASSQIAVSLGANSNVVTLASNLTNGSSGLYFGATSLAHLHVGFTSAGTGASTSTAVDLTGLAANASASDIVSALNNNASFSSDFTAQVKSVTSGGTTTNYVAVFAKDGGTVTATNDSATANTQASLSGTAASSALDFSSASGAESAITSIQGALDNITAVRATIGAAENRFDSVSSAIATSITNLTAANSRITDVDMASAMVNYSKQNILAQTGTAMLSQANASSQLVLKLLQS